MPQGSAQSNMLTAKGLHKHYQMGPHDLHVLRGVDVAIRQGQWLAIAGASGSGKSTLMHLLGGLDRPSRGEVVFQGDNVFAMGESKLNAYRGSQVGFVFQFYHLLPELTALENVWVSAMISTGPFVWPFVRRDRFNRASQLLQDLGLADRLRHRPAKLSGGERQRVAIARALVNEPAVLMADEPTGNLDAHTGGQILDVFRQFHASGQTIVMVTHDETVAAAADRRLHLEAGRLKG